MKQENIFSALTIVRIIISDIEPIITDHKTANPHIIMTEVMMVYWSK